MRLLYLYHHLFIDIERENILCVLNRVSFIELLATINLYYSAFENEHTTAMLALFCRDCPEFWLSPDSTRFRFLSLTSWTTWNTFDRVRLHIRTVRIWIPNIWILGKFSSRTIIWIQLNTILPIFKMVYYKIPAILSQNIKKPDKKVWYFERYLKTCPFDIRMTYCHLNTGDVLWIT